MNTPNNIKRGLMITTSIWGTLGYYRGTREYEFEYNKNIEYYKKNDAPLNKPNRFYITNILYGLYGTLLYLNPVTVPVCLMKEIYRLEINLRRLEDEKKTTYYNAVYSL